MKKKARHIQRTSFMTLEQFLRRLKNGRYHFLVGAKRAITRMQLGEAETKKALAAATRAFK